jgi:hypothetical protein
MLRVVLHSEFNVMFTLERTFTSKSLSITAKISFKRKD